jgi:hypothetical protein
VSNLGVTEPGADTPADTPPPGPARFVFPELGAAAQAAVPGFYAWGVTIMPAAWSRGAPVLAKLSAIAGVIALVGFVLAEPRLGWRARIGGVWSLLAAGVVTWAAAPSALSAFHLDAVHGIAGMFGWGLFAYASAGPAIRRTPSAEAALAVVGAPGAAGAPGGAGAAAAAAPPRGRLRLRRGDHAYIGAALLVATLLQTVGWSVVVPERALFVRLVTLMAAIALLGASAELATARYARRKRPSPRARLRRALPLLVGLAVVGIIGVILAFTIVPWLVPF